MKHLRLTPDKFVFLIPPLILLVLWWVLSVLWVPFINYTKSVSPQFAVSLPDFTFLSSPQQALKSVYLLNAKENLWFHVIVTTLRSLGAFILASVLGGFLGWLLATRKQFEKVVLPSVEGLRALPPIALLPIFILIVGIGESLSISFATFGAVFPITIATYAAVKGVDTVPIEVGKNLGLTDYQIARYIIIPLSSPGCFTGLRIAFPLTLILVIVSEMLVGSGDGLGGQIDLAKRSFRFDDMMAMVIITAVVGLFLNKLFAFAERRILWWDARFRAEDK